MEKEGKRIAKKYKRLINPVKERLDSAQRELITNTINDLVDRVAAIEREKANMELLYLVKMQEDVNKVTELYNHELYEACDIFQHVNLVDDDPRIYFSERDGWIETSIQEAVRERLWKIDQEYEKLNPPTPPPLSGRDWSAVVKSLSVSSETQNKE